MDSGVLVCGGFSYLDTGETLTASEVARTRNEFVSLELRFVRL